MTPAFYCDLARREYGECLELQRRLVQARQEDEIADTLLLVEHPDVVTVGRRKDAHKNVHAHRFPVVEIERGGDVTYHGPGQLVAYPIVKLDENERDLHQFLRNLEEGIIHACETLGLGAERNPGWTGVWAGARKIASLGISVRRWVTFHGLALNVCTDLSKFAVIAPCGLQASVMSSLTEQLGRPVTLAEVKPLLVEGLSQSLGRNFARASKMPPQYDVAITA